jgi:tetratricopeptide (TPR) repeat protein
MLFNQLIQEFPERKEGYFNRGLCLYKTEKYSEAVLDLGTCLQMDSVFSLARVLKGLCLQRSGNLQEAMQTYSEISGRRCAPVFYAKAN